MMFGKARNKNLLTGEEVYNKVISDIESILAEDKSRGNADTMARDKLMLDVFKTPEMKRKIIKRYAFDPLLCEYVPKR